MEEGRDERILYFIRYKVNVSAATKKWKSETV